MQLVISITPDLRNAFGHWFQFEKILADATNRANDLFLSLANVNCELVAKGFDILPVFTDSTYRFRIIYNENEKQTIAEQVSKVLVQQLKHYDKDISLKFIMYTGDITYIDAFDSFFTSYRGRVTFSINLFYTHFDYNYKEKVFVKNEELYRKIINRDYLGQRPWLKVLVDSERMCLALEMMFGIRLGLWPMINFDVKDKIVQQLDKKPESSEKLIVFPGNGQFAKGFDLTCKFIEKYGQILAEKHQCKFLLRDQMRDSPENNLKLESMLGRISEHTYVKVAKGVLSETKFLELFFHADLVILPYRKSSFYSRTSSCVVNAILSASPLLVTEDTWMAEQVAFFQCGAVFEDGDIDSIYSAICEHLANPRPGADPDIVKSWYSTENLLRAIY